MKGVPSAVSLNYRNWSAIKKTNWPFTLCKKTQKQTHTRTTKFSGNRSSRVLNDNTIIEKSPLGKHPPKLNCWIFNSLFAPLTPVK